MWWLRRLPTYEIHHHVGTKNEAKNEVGGRLCPRLEGRNQYSLLIQLGQDQEISLLPARPPLSAIVVGAIGQSDTKRSVSDNTLIIYWICPKLE